MSAWGALGPGTRVLALVAGGAVAAGAGYLVWQSTLPAEIAVPAQPVPQTPIVPEGKATVAVDPQAETAPVPEDMAAEAAVQGGPGIDTWRVAPDGAALVAGLAAPMALVAVLVDGANVAEGKALASGEFVLQFILAPNPAPSLMTLSMTEPGKAAVTFDEMVALGPIAGPVVGPVNAPIVAPVVAEVTPDAGVAAGDAAVAVADTALAATAAPPPPAALLLTEAGTVVLQKDIPADPSLMAQVMIDTITYTPAGAVQVGGRGAAGSTVRIYLDNAEVAVLPVPTDGHWLATMGDTAPGIYTLRVDQLDASGAVTSRFETPFLRETLEALASTAAQPIVAGQAPAAPVEASPDPAPEVATAAETANDPLAEPLVAPAEPEPQAPATTPAVLAEAAPEPLPPVSEPVGKPVGKPVSVTVQPGFTLWGIAQDSLGDGVLYVQVFAANRDKIKDPNLIYPGQILSVPATP